MIDLTTKQTIKTELAKRVSHIGSAKKASVELGISNATVSNILNDKDEMISDDMWRKLAAILGCKLNDAWQHADTKPFKSLLKLLKNAKMHSNTFCATVKPGSVKTHTLDFMRANYQNVLSAKCNRHTTERNLLADILTSAGKPAQSYRSAEMLKTLVAVTSTMESPVIIIDEFEKVKPDTFLLSIDIYNALEGKCGIVFLGTPNLKTKIENGVERCKLGYNEFESRIGGKVMEIPANDHEDAVMLVKAQGITAFDTMLYKGKEVNAMDHIINEAANDFNEIDVRILKRQVHVFKQKQIA